MEETSMTNYCAIHNQAEEVDPDPYRICIECGHVYNTPESLVIAYNEDQPELNIDPVFIKTLDQVDSIWFCPICLHDF